MCCASWLVGMAQYGAIQQDGSKETMLWERGKWSSGDSMAKKRETGQSKKEKVKKFDTEGKQFLQIL